MISFGMIAVCASNNLLTPHVSTPAPSVLPVYPSPSCHPVGPPQRNPPPTAPLPYPPCSPSAINKQNYLAVRGTAYRRFRHGNPLPNIWRQWCDAKGQLCVVVEQDKAGDSGQDGLVVDMAPLRLEDTSRVG